MRSPKDMTIIEIDITNACIHMCSNCTRFCGHHKKNFFMSFEQFKEAVDSLKEYGGMVGIIGGEPTLHPEFEKFVEYLHKSRIGERVVPVARAPIPSMKNFIANNLECDADNKVVLCSSLNKTYYKHFETIMDTFQRQIVNDHDNKSKHQALLMPRKYLGISDEEWIKKRDCCWVQNQWSATITPKGAFFCEVAGSFDMLFDGPGGWKVEPNWWKRTPEEFKDQLHWCEMCSGCLDVPQRISNDERDDITPQMYERLKAIGSPKVAKNKIVIHDPKMYDKNSYHTFTGGNDYMESAGNVRTIKKNPDYYPKDFLYINSIKSLPSVIKKKQADDWIILSENADDGELALQYFSNVVINPGCVYLTDNNVAVFNVHAKSLRELSDKLRLDENVSLGNIWSYYPMDKIVKVNLLEAIYEKYKADCLEEIKIGANIAVLGNDAWSRKLFLKLMEDGLYVVCGWFDMDKIFYSIAPMDFETLKVVDHVIVAFASSEQCEIAEMALRKFGVPAEKILKFSVPYQRGC